MPYSSQRWKRQEREIAELLGGYRIPNSGYGQPDVVAGSLAVQVKTRLDLPLWFIKAVDQSIVDAQEGQQPVVIISLVSPGKKARRFLVADLAHVLTEGDEE